jgi:protein phosphatase
LAAVRRAELRGVSVSPLLDSWTARAAKVERYAEAWRGYAWPVKTIDDLKIAPFHLLASEGAVHFDKDHAWHISIASRLVEAGGAAFALTRSRRLDVLDQEPARKRADGGKN